VRLNCEALFCRGEEIDVIAPGEPPSPVGADSAPTNGHVYTGEVNTLVDIYSKHERRIYRYCLALLRNPDDAEDATQETFTRAAPFLPNLAGDLSAYLTTVARNICCDVVRARARRPISIDYVALPDRAVSPERQSIDWDVVRRMWRQLSPSERLLFAYTFAGYRYEEIASRTGMSRPAVSVGLTRARRRLRDLATAIGALGLLPLGVRRLLDRISRRANAALASGQQALLAAVEQMGAVTAGLLAGLVTLGAGGTAAAVSAPAMAAAAYHSRGTDALTSAASGPAATVTSTAATSASSVASQAEQRAPHPAPAPQPLAPVNQAALALPGGDATPADTLATSVTTSPDYTHDGIVFMTGDDFMGCANGSVCPALFRSEDRGASWARLWPATYQGGDVLLSPHYPADPGVFVLRPTVGLTVSPNGDGTFTTAVPAASAAAVAPDSAVGHARFAAVVNGAVVTYTLGDAAPQPGPVLPAGFNPNGVVFATADRVVVAGWRLSTSGLTSMSEPVLANCPLSGVCGTPIPLPGANDAGVRTVPNRNLGGPLLVYSTRRAFLSTDSGLSFHGVFDAPADQVLEFASTGATTAGPRVVVSLADMATQRRSTVRYSDDLGATFTDATGNLDSLGTAIAIEVLPSGDMLVGLNADTTRHFALRLSSGNGVWAAPRPS
jgi:RNA polymerase sigma-70 factor, ECF subfamily